MRVKRTSPKIAARSSGSEAFCDRSPGVAMCSDHSMSSAGRRKDHHARRDVGVQIDRIAQLERVRVEHLYGISSPVDVHILAVARNAEVESRTAVELLFTRQLIAVQIENPKFRPPVS